MWTILRFAIYRTLRYIFRSLQDLVIQKWATDDSVRTRAVR